MEERAYVTAKDAALRWGLTPRRVQQLCREGLVEGAERAGRAWLVPDGAARPEAAGGRAGRREAGPGTFMPLSASAFSPGGAEARAARLPARIRPLARAELCYFRGQAERAAALAEPFLDCADTGARLTARLLCGFAGLSLGRVGAAREALEGAKEGAAGGREGALGALEALAAAMAGTLLHLPDPDGAPLEDALGRLPEGLGPLACYVLAHRAYLEGRCERGLAIAETALAWQAGPRPIPSVYLRLMAAVCAMGERRVEEARAHFRRAWAIAEPDGLIEPFGEHHGLLQGLVEAELRAGRPEDYERVVALTYRFAAGWRGLHNPEAGHPVADDLTALEFSVAMLADRGWTYRQIGEHLGMSPHTVSKRLSGAYRKLGVKTRGGLREHMLW